MSALTIVRTPRTLAIETTGRRDRFGHEQNEIILNVRLKGNIPTERGQQILRDVQEHIEENWTENHQRTLAQILAAWPVAEVK